MKKAINWLVSEESGQGMVEYGLILALVAVVAVVALGLIGGQLKTIFNDIVTKLGGKAEAAPKVG